MRSGTFDCLGDPRQRLRAVDQDLETAAVAGRRVPRGPQSRVRWRVELPGATGAVQAVAMMSADGTLNGPAGEGVKSSNQGKCHGTGV